jgi:hypothetical protein
MPDIGPARRQFPIWKNGCSLADIGQKYSISHFDKGCALFF